MRLFVALEFDGRVKENISSLCDVLRARGVSGGFTSKENLHLTLKFLGEVKSGDVGDLSAALRKAALGFGAFEIRTSRFGSFGNGGEKTVWLGVEHSEKLDRLFLSVEENLTALGYKKERRPFTAHITLARRAGFEKDALRFSVPSTVIPVKAVTLFESTRINGALRYIPISRAPL
jgi:2'-5' RNA ligase